MSDILESASQDTTLPLNPNLTSTCVRSVTDACGAVPTWCVFVGRRSVELNNVPDFQIALGGAGTSSGSEGALCLSAGRALDHLLCCYFPYALGVVARGLRERREDPRLPAEQRVVRSRTANRDEAVACKNALCEQLVVADCHSFLLELRPGTVPLVAKHGSTPFDVSGVLLWSPRHTCDAVSFKVVECFFCVER